MKRRYLLSLLLLSLLSARSVAAAEEMDWQSEREYRKSIAAPTTRTSIPVLKLRSEVYKQLGQDALAKRDLEQIQRAYKSDDAIAPFSTK